MRCIEIIETNLSIDKENTIRDHQSRVIEANSWNEYCKAYQDYDGKGVSFKEKVTKGSSLRSNCKISNLKYDNMHLSCDITILKGNGEEVFTNRRLACRIANPT